MEPPSTCDIILGNATRRLNTAGGAKAGLMEGAVQIDDVLPTGYVLLRDHQGLRTAVRQNSIQALGETEDMRTTVLLPGGKMVLLEEPFDDAIQRLLIDAPGRPRSR